MIDKSSEYSFQIQLTKARDYGQFDLYLNGKAIVNKIDLYSPSVSLADAINLSRLKMEKGQHKVSFKLVGKNIKATPYQKNRYLLGLDFIKIVNMLPPAKESKADLTGISPSQAKDDSTTTESNSLVPVQL